MTPIRDQKGETKMVERCSRDIIHATHSPPMSHLFCFRIIVRPGTPIPDPPSSGSIRSPSTNVCWSPRPMTSFTVSPRMHGPAVKRVLKAWTTDVSGMGHIILS